MWLLKDENNEKLIYLKPNATMTIGRNKGDLVLPEDKSISRVHAHITVETLPDFNKITEKMQPLSSCTIKDGGSKYGNFLLKNDVPLRISEEGLKLQHEDRIRFGLQDSIFIVHYIPIITATSGMSEDEKEKLKRIIDTIDGKMIYTLNHLCTHMTVVKPTISEKLSCALATVTPIVSFDYWNSVVKAFEENNALPDPADFSNSIESKMREIGNISVKPNPARQTLFKNLTFVHFSHKQYVLYSRMIKLAGGKSLQYGKQLPLPDICDNRVIVVQYVESNTTQATGTGDANYIAVCEQLRECRRRTIPESEIAIALLHCSTVKYCNPMYDYAELFAPRTRNNPPQNMTVLAVDTQDMLGPSTSGHSDVNNARRAPLFIPETVQESCDIEVQPAKQSRQNLRNPANDPESIDYRSEEANRSESVADSVSDDVPSESQIGSMKLASLNYEDYVREEFNTKPSTDELSAKRVRDSEDDESQERKKKLCLRPTPIDKAKEPDYRDTMPDDDDDFVLDEPMNIVGKDREKKQGRQTSMSRLTSEKLPSEDFNRRTPIDEMAMKRSRDSDDDRSEARKKKTCLRLSSIDKANKQDYKDMKSDDDDVLDEPVSVVEKDLDKERTPASRLSAEQDLEESDVFKRRKTSKITDYFAGGAFSKSTSVVSRSRNEKDSYRNQMIETAKSKPSEDSTTDQQEQSYKRKPGRSVFSPFSDDTENRHKRTKSEIANEKQIDSRLKKSSSEKRPLMDLPSSSMNPYKIEIKEEGNWISNVSIDYVSEKDISAVSDSSQRSFGRSYDKSDYIKLPNNPNGTLLPLLRINGPADIVTKNGRRFGKCFRKQKIKIPVRVELDGSTYDSWSEKKGKSR